ncbi:hypothetical protein FACS189494_08030 [Spirochaetia bacterium]|nr:hypothetical protein FACS189494_08030 [Spirochaetia bacterium]
MISLIDCTLRDGGHLNKSTFGENTIHNIINNLVKSKVEIIELGFLKEQEYNPDICVFSCIADAKKIIQESQNVEYCIMYDPKDKYDVSKLEECDGTVRHIRISFHNYDFDEGIEFAKQIIKKGYCCHVNPINTPGYTDRELIDVLYLVNELGPFAFSIVDTFGTMTESDLSRIVAIVENNLDINISVGLHLHENLALSYSLAQYFTKIKPPRRSISVDASLNGMGRVPGNLNIELIMEYLNRVYDKKYDTDPIYDAIDDYILPIKQKIPWGYSLPYALSAQYRLHRTYAEFLISKSKLKIRDIKNILGSINDSSKVVFNETYIRKLYIDYLCRDIDDTEFQRNLKQELETYKDVLLLAPGASLKKNIQEINEFIERIKPVVIVANFDSNLIGIKPDYLFFTNIQRFERLQEVHNKLIITSNILEYSMNHSFVLSFRNLICDDCDNALIMLLKFLQNCNRRKVYIAGFDGFSNANDYSIPVLNTAYEKIVAKENENVIVNKMLIDKFSGIDIFSLTPTFYIGEKTN